MYEFLAYFYPRNGISEKKIGDKSGDGEQHFGDWKKYPCFKYERYKPEYKGVRNCTYTVKKDSSAVNTKDMILKKFEELKKAKQRGQ